MRFSDSPEPSLSAYPYGPESTGVGQALSHIKQTDHPTYWW